MYPYVPLKTGLSVRNTNLNHACASSSSRTLGHHKQNNLGGQGWKACQRKKIQQSDNDRRITCSWLVSQSSNGGVWWVSITLPQNPEESATKYLSKDICCFFCLPERKVNIGCNWWNLKAFANMTLRSIPGVIKIAAEIFSNTQAVICKIFLTLREIKL